MNRTITFIWLLAVLLTWQSVTAEKKCVEGFVMDVFCINRTTLLDAPNIKTLENPELHSLHCLVDVPQCRASGYHILELNPTGTPKYRSAYKLDTVGNNEVIKVAREIGDKTAGCTSCVGSMLEKGFRATVFGEVTENPNGIPLLKVETLLASPILSNATASNGCNEGVKTTVTAASTVTTPTTTTITTKTSNVGEEICVEGFVMDVFCINRTTLLDAPNIKTLENPELHSMHCLVDVPQCRESGYHILSLNPTGTTPKYRSAYQLDTAGNNEVIKVAREIGDKTAGCNTCVGSMLKKGFRATVNGRVTANPNGIPLLTITTLVASPILSDATASNGCNEGVKTTVTAASTTTTTTTTTTKTPTNSEVSNIGKRICVEGFVMDKFCINLGTLLDAPSVKTLENPELHSFHCLVDVPQCRASGYHILFPNPTGTTPKYRSAYQLDTAGNNKVIEVARITGDKSEGCTTCMGSGMIKQGFRAKIVGVVSKSSNGPPILTVETLVASPILFNATASDGCMESNASILKTSWGLLLPTLVLSAHFLKHVFK